MKAKPSEDRFFWRMVDDMGWGRDGNFDYDAIGAKAVALVKAAYNAGQAPVIAQSLWVAHRAKETALSRRLYRIFNGHGGDDSFDDFVNHIIGQGEEVYNRVMADPNEALAFLDSYRESFAYCWHGLYDFAGFDEA